MSKKPESYPFLRIAKRYGVDYGDVLALADLNTPGFMQSLERIEQHPKSNYIISDIKLCRAYQASIRDGRIDWQTGEEICQDEGCPHYGTPHGHGEAR